MAKDPAGRPASAEAVADELAAIGRQVLAGGPAAVAPPQRRRGAWCSAQFSTPP
jgi:hypothetical protein